MSASEKLIYKHFLFAKARWMQEESEKKRQKRTVDEATAKAAATTTVVTKIGTDIKESFLARESQRSPRSFLSEIQKALRKNRYVNHSHCT